MRQCIGDVLIKMNRSAALPDSYLHRGSDADKWMSARGKRRFAMQDRETERRLRNYFNQLTVNGSHEISKADVEEILVSFGLC